MFSYDDIANHVIQNLSNASINIAHVQEELRNIIAQKKIYPSDDMKTTIHLLRRATHLASVFLNKSKYITLYDLETASKLFAVQLENVSVPMIQFKLPSLPLCYVNEGIVKLLEKVLTMDSEIDYRLTFKPNFLADRFYTIVRFKKNSKIRSIADKLKLKHVHYKNMTLVYI